MGREGIIYCRMNVCASESEKRGVATDEEVIEESEVWEDIAERFPNCCFVGCERNGVGSPLFNQNQASLLVAILMRVGC